MGWAALAIGLLVQADAAKVAALIEALDSPEVVAREEAQCTLLRLGAGVRPAVTAALAQAGGERRLRLEAVLDGLLAAEQEEFALRCLRGHDQAPAQLDLRRRGATLADAIANLRRRHDSAPELFPGDERLARAARAEPFHTLRGSPWTPPIIVTGDMETTLVAERGRLVVVRLTPRLFLERAPCAVAPQSELARQLAWFDGRPSPGWDPEWWEEMPPDAMRRWAHRLAGVVTDEGHDAVLRRKAIAALVSQGAAASDAPDALLRLARSARAPRDLRDEADVHLPRWHDATARRAVLERLRDGDAAARKRLLFSLGVLRDGAIAAFRDGAREELDSALQRLEADGDAGVAFSAQCVRAILLGGEQAAIRLAAVRDFPDGESPDLFVEAVERVLDTAEAPGLVAFLASHPSARSRAGAARLLAWTREPPDAARAQETAVRLLVDKEPIVRWTAVGAFSAPWWPRDGSRRTVLSEALDLETDARVCDALKPALEAARRE